MAEPPPADPTIAGKLPADVGEDAVAEARARRRGPLRSAALAIGAAALLLAMATDALAVAGRHLGFTVLGAIEIFEACIVVAATAALLLATLDHGHAQVRILTERLRPTTAHRLERATNALSALIFVVLAGGSAWLASDLWGGHEVTELLGLPLRWLRAFWIAGALLVAALFAVRAVRGPRP
ncbi:MAG TPA: TRAP transporter small permease subunit [Sphingomonas sp.]|nr:TRAP transporter small permease subunit [Sphingomonas sp.]